MATAFPFELNNFSQKVSHTADPAPFWLEKVGNQKQIILNFTSTALKAGLETASIMT